MLNNNNNNNSTNNNVEIKYETDDENNNLTLSKILLDVANSKRNDYFYDEENYNSNQYHQAK